MSIFLRLNRLKSLSQYAYQLHCCSLYTSSAIKSDDFGNASNEDLVKSKEKNNKNKSNKKNGNKVNINLFLNSLKSEKKIEINKLKNRTTTHNVRKVFFKTVEKETEKPSSPKFISLSQKHWNENIENIESASMENEFDRRMRLYSDKEWLFPIDNEQDLGVEDETSFEEHVFLDHLLEEFPESASVQKFMELVITGLQQNPYLTVKEKHDKILWFKDYFERFPKEELETSVEEFG